ncbi:MAG TPA: lipocalin family protein [Hanamia sp.]|nr:lipocalin family protein [Hanamia sp.]
MKKFLSAFAILAFFSFSFTACKKEKTKTAAEQIVGTWQLTSIVYNEHTNGADHTISSNDFTSSDTYEFRADGTVYATVQGSSDNSTYTISDNKLTITDDDTYDIKTLDAHNMVLYVKDVNGADHTEATITFKR